MTNKSKTNKRTTFQDKLKKLEDEKQKIIDKRKNQLVNILDKIGYLDVDNELLAGAILFIRETLENKETKSENQKILEEFRARSAKFFRRKI